MYGDIAVDIGTHYSGVFEWHQGLVPLNGMSALHSRQSEYNQPATEVGSEMPEEAYLMRSVLVREGAKGRRFLYAGERAANMVGKVGRLRSWTTPINEGRLGDEDAFVGMLEELTQASTYFRWVKRAPTKRPRVILPVAHNTEQADRRSFRNLITEDLKANPILVSQPVAAAIGAGMPIDDKQACMIVDIGGGTTDIVVVCYTEIPDDEPESIPIGGHAMNARIVEYVRQEHKLEIGFRTAEYIKHELGSATRELGRSCTVMGKLEKEAYEQRLRAPRAHKSGDESKMLLDLTLRSEEIYDHCMRDFVERIALGITNHFVRMGGTGELHYDIQKRGICLTGGSSKLRNLAPFLKERTGIEMNLAPKPLLSVLIGAGKMLRDPKLLELGKRALHDTPSIQ